MDATETWQVRCTDAAGRSRTSVVSLTHERRITVAFPPPGMGELTGEQAQGLRNALGEAITKLLTDGKGW